MNKRIGLAAGGLAAALVMVGGTAFAAVSQSIPDSNGVIHGCYDSGGNVKVIDTSVTPSCPRGYTELNWNQTGPQGPQGTAGSNGSNGANGTDGTNGTNGVNGANGANGSSVVTSPGAPAGTCNTGDTNVDLANGEVYSCNASAWTDTGSSIEGPPGPKGPVGQAGPPGTGLTVTQGTGTSSPQITHDGTYFVNAEVVLNIHTATAVSGFCTIGIPAPLATMFPDLLVFTFFAPAGGQNAPFSVSGIVTVIGVTAPANLLVTCADDSLNLVPTGQVFWSVAPVGTT